MDLEANLGCFLDKNFMSDIFDLLKACNPLGDEYDPDPNPELKPTDPDPNPELKPTDPESEPTPALTLQQSDPSTTGECSQDIYMGATPQMFQTQTTRRAPARFQSAPRDTQFVQVPERSAQQKLQSTRALKRKRDRLQTIEQPHIKKPPNAFMLYLKEQRAIVKAELGAKDSAAVNAEVGKRWKSLSKQAKETYRDQARAEERRHAEQHPGWSNSENYGKKRSRKRTSNKAQRQTAGDPAQPTRNRPTISMNWQTQSDGLNLLHPMNSPQTARPPGFVHPSHLYLMHGDNNFIQASCAPGFVSHPNHLYPMYGDNSFVQMLCAPGFVSHPSHLYPMYNFQSSNYPAMPQPFSPAHSHLTLRGPIAEDTRNVQ